MQNQHPIDLSPWAQPLWKERVLDGVPSAAALLHEASMNRSFGQRLTNSRAFLFPFYVVLRFDEC